MNAARPQPAVEGLDHAKLAAARLWAAHRYPYLASALFASPIVEADGSGAVTVDERWRIRADPEVVAGWDVGQLGSQLVHHCSHLLRDHAARARALAVGDERRLAWVDAADAEINDDLPADMLPPGPVVLPETLGAEPGRFAEEYFRQVPAPAPSGNDCGSGAHGLACACERADERSGASPLGGVSATEGELLRRRVASDVLAVGRGQGDVPAGLLRWAAILAGASVDWRSELAAELRQGIAATAGAVDYSYSRPSRRSAAVGDVVLPALRRPQPEIAVVCDTSASVSSEMLGAALAEIDGVTAAVGRRGVRVVACDTAVGDVRRVTAATQLELVGGGGTDMGAGLAAAAALTPRPQVVVVLTDGYTPWPDEPPPALRVVVGLMGQTTADPPGWARAVRIDGPHTAVAPHGR